MIGQDDSRSGEPRKIPHHTEQWSRKPRLRQFNRRDAMNAERKSRNRTSRSVWNDESLLPHSIRFATSGSAQISSQLASDIFQGETARTAAGAEVNGKRPDAA